MRKTLKLARREYLAAVRTKGFVIALVVAPLMMSGSGVAFALLKDRVDTRERRIALVDPAGLVAPAVLEAAARRDETETRHPQSGRQIRPAYRFEVPEGAAPLDDAARLELSNRVRRGDLSAFVEVGPEALHPGAEEYVPYAALPWFLGFLALAILMYGAIFTAVGAACNDTKEAQSATFPAMVPIILPMFVLMPLLQHPNSSFATWLSLIPVFTPLAMVLRLASPVGIPSWQPWLGLGLVLATTALAVWAGGRVFRVAILMQGTPPRLATLARWALRG
jgi:ABC-type Na+ efflux pump permease subunit